MVQRCVKGQQDAKESAGRKRQTDRHRERGRVEQDQIKETKEEIWEKMENIKKRKSNSGLPREL